MTDLLQQSDPTQEPNLDLLAAELVKTRSHEDLAKKAVHADQTIEVMTKRLDQLTEDYKKVREENITKAKLEDLLDKLSQQPSGNNTPANEVTPKPVELKDIEALVSNKIAQTKVVEKEQENLNIVKNKLLERFGTNYQNTIKQQIETLGLSSDDFHALAKKSPAALFRTLGVDEPKQDGYQAPVRSSQRNDNFAPTGAAKRTWAYYQELKKKDPLLYYDRKTAVQMQKDAVELGAAFRDGDYYVKGLHDE